MASLHELVLQCHAEIAESSSAVVDSIGRAFACVYKFLPFMVLMVLLNFIDRSRQIG
jgi:ABC-type spermidine/putrescine transport system permease subunit I